MPALRPDVDPDGLLEYSVVYTDRALNHMSARFQKVLTDITATLKEVYAARAVAIVPGSGTYGMEAVARQFATGRHVLVTSGPTHEPIDPVRYIANRSSGKSYRGPGLEVGLAAFEAQARPLAECGIEDLWRGLDEALPERGEGLGRHARHRHQAVLFEPARLALEGVELGVAGDDDPAPVLGPAHQQRQG